MPPIQGQCRESPVLYDALSQFFGPSQGESFSVGAEKRLSSPSDSAQTKGCVDTTCAPQSILYLNASILYRPDSLYVNLTSPEDLTFNFRALVDSGSTHSFVDTMFVSAHGLRTDSVTPIALKLFDGTSNSTITKSCTIPVRFPCGTSQAVTFYVTQLDSSCSAVLGHDWLARHNPSIDWVTSSIMFRTPTASDSVPTSSFARAATALLPPPDSEILAPLSSNTIDISVLSTDEFFRTVKTEQIQCYSLVVSDNGAYGRSSTTAPASTEDLQPIPKKYHDFAGCFQ